MNPFLLLVIGISFADCPEPVHGPADVPFRAQAPAQGAVVFEIPLTGSAPSPQPILDALQERGLHATLLPSLRWARTHTDTLKAAHAAGHEIGVWFSLTEDLGLRGKEAQDPVFNDWVRAIRRTRKGVKRASGAPVHTVAMSLLPMSGEMASEALGFRVILPSERTIGGTLRRAQTYVGSAGRARIIGQGPYEDGCGSDLLGWNATALDRATGAVARGSWVRIGLPHSTHARPLLDRWLDEVVIPNGWPVSTAESIARKSKKIIAVAPAPKSVEPVIAVVRTVPKETMIAVATTLADAKTLPRILSDGLNLTEAWVGLCMLVATPAHPDTVTLGPLKGPVEVARTGLREPRSLNTDSVRAKAQSLSGSLGGHAPALVTVDGTTLTAAEFLQTLARVALGQPAVASPVSDPDPFSPGGGWGVSDGL